MGLFPLRGLLRSASEKSASSGEKESDVPLIITPPPLVHSSTHLKKIRAETLTAMRAQNNERFLDFVLVNLSLPMTLFSTRPIVSADCAGHAVIDAFSRRRGFADFRRSDLHVSPLLFFQCVLTVFYALTSSSLLTQFPHTRLVYATVSAFMCACALGWALVGLHYFFLRKASLAASGANPHAAEGVPQPAPVINTDAEEELVVNNNVPRNKTNAQSTQDVDRCRTEADIVAHTLLFRTHHPVPDWLLHLEILWLLALFCSVHLLSFAFCQETIADPSNPVTPKPSRISDSILALSLLLPTFGYLLVKVLSFRLAFLLWLCSVLYTLALILSFGFTQSWSPLVIFSCLSFFLLVKVHRKDWLSFVLATDLRLALIENTLKSEEIKSNELKHMLGNIAHDLKTPMSCVVSGLELLSSLAGELRQHLRSQDEASLENLSGRVETISELASSLEHTNALMAMTINRCLDYHRTMHGQQLVPHIEPVPLETALLMPVHCLQNIMPGVSVQVVFSPPTLRRERVFTDKHWLHDNLVCLIGNALKYSQRQPVLVRVSQLLVPHTDSSLLTGERALVREERKGKEEEGEDVGEEKKELLDDIEAHMFIPTGREEIVRMRRSFSFASREELKQERKEEEEKHERGEQEALAHKLTPAIEHREIVLFEVLDRGPGLGCLYNDLSAVFGEPSQTSRPVGGSGLGLFSLARRVSTLGGHYGTHPRTDESQGCCFWFSLPFDSRGCVALSPLSREPSLQVQGAQSTRDEFSSPSLPPPSPPLLSRSASQASVEGEAVVPPPPAPLFLPALHVLVVDDSTVITRMVSMLLKRHGHRVCTAENGLVALQLLRRSLRLKPLRFSGEAAVTPVSVVAQTNGALPENEKLSLNEEEHIASLSSAFSTPVDEFPRVDVVLMDFQMPVMCGVEAIRRIRALEEQLAGKDRVARNFGFSSPQSPVQHKIIGISAKSDPDEISQAFEAGMNAFMPKPFTMELFYQTLNSIS